MIEQLHIAAQYLSAFAYSYKKHKDDDSQSNLGFNTKKNRLFSRKHKGFRLGLNLNEFNLEWLYKGKVKNELLLDGKTHEEALDWINKQLGMAKLEGSFQFKFNYELPFDSFGKDSVFSITSRAEMDKIATNFSQAKRQLKKFLNKNDLESSVRIWPHHFDMGIYTKLDKSKNLFFGGGLAIPDTLEDVQYYYATGWLNGDAVKTADFSGLSNGRWHKEWDGATLPASNLKEGEIENFLQETYQRFSASK